MPAQAAPSPAARRRAKPACIIAVASGKGGVGKTWFSATLASALGRMGRRVLLVDCDVGLANLDVQLGIRPESDLQAVVRGWMDLEAAICPIMGGPGRGGGFDIVAGHSGTGALASISADETLAICQGVRRAAPHYDWVILDLAAGLDPPTMRFARTADRLLLVVTEEPTSLTDAYAFAKVMRLQQPDTKAPLVAVNMAESKAKGARVFDQFSGACEKYLGTQPALLGVIGRDARVPEAIRAQTPLVVRHPQAPALEDVARIAETLLAL
jgi:flagellar biosynthesis protein FlhG